MKIVEIGKIGAMRNGILPFALKLPEHGIIIEATPQEIKDMGVNLLYHEIRLQDAEGGNS